MMLDGIRNLAPTGVMLMFAILYFGIMIDAGLFEPFVRRIVRVVHGDPVQIVIGTAVLALLVSLDGDGSTTYMITVAAMLPLYRRLGIRPIDARVRDDARRRRDEHPPVGRADGARGERAPDRQRADLRADDPADDRRRACGCCSSRARSGCASGATGSSGPGSHDLPETR